MNARIDQLARRREALQRQAADERENLGRLVRRVARQADPWQRAVRWAGVGLFAWRLWRRWCGQR